MQCSWRALAAVGLLLLMASWAFAQPTLKLTVSPQRENGSFTGRYVAKVEVTGASSAREVVVNLRIPKAYTIDTAAQDIRIKDVVPGADLYTVQVQGNPTPVCFVESSNVNDRYNIWIVALLTSEAKDTKHVCDIVFTAKGRPTTVRFNYGDVAVKDGDLNVLVDTGTFASARCPLFGDLDWDGAIGITDFALFVAALRQGTYVAWADLMPVADGSPPPSDPVHAISAGDGQIGIADFGAWVMALRNAPQ